MKNTGNYLTNQDGPKDYLNIKCFRALKLQYMEEAKDLGMTLSSYTESSLASIPELKEAVKRAKTEAAELKRELDKMKSEWDLKERTYGDEINRLSAGNASLKSDLSAKERENEQLKEKIRSMNSQQLVYQDKRFLWVHEQVKGKSAKIVAPDGAREILDVTIKTQEDTIRALAYSFKVDKSNKYAF